MRPITYARPTDVPTAIDGVAQTRDAAYLGGGTNLVDLMKIDVMTPAHIVDLTPLARHTALARIETLPDGGLRIGALATNSALAWHPLVRQRYPVLSQALLSGATVQIRNMATVSGNLLQRTRCYYFRDIATPCNKREPGTGCSAIDGFNRMHAVLGGSEKCIATHPSDMAVALAALDATVRVRGPHGERMIPLVDFHTLPDDHPEVETVLAHGELITAVDLPAMPFATRSCYLKVRDRASFAFALASAAVALDVQQGTIRQARLALGGVGTKPWRSTDAEAALVGRPATVESYRAAADLALRGAVPRQHNAFKVDLAKRTIVRALATAGSLA